MTDCYCLVVAFTVQRAWILAIAMLFVTELSLFAGNAISSTLMESQSWWSQLRVVDGMIPNRMGLLFWNWIKYKSSYSHSNWYLRLAHWYC
jgi:Na+-transporting NADH:ubiquinone oxidoreductase subunit NqrD